MSMFAPLEQALQKRQAPESREADDEAGPAGDGNGETVTKLQKAMAKLLMQHEDTLRNNCRDDNFVMNLKADSRLARALETGVEEYDAEGKKAREENKGDDYKGHPKGKKPDAYGRLLVFRVAEVVQADMEKVQQAAAQGQFAVEAAGAVTKLVEWGTRAGDPKAHFMATRCFRVLVQENDVEVAKWIMAVNCHQELKSALEVLRLNGALKAVGVQLTFDTAPRSKQAKEIERLAFSKGGKSRPKGAKRAKK